MHLAILGGGFSAASTAAAVLPKLEAASSITIYEPSADLGRGIAYARGPDHYLLNVAAHTLTLNGADKRAFLNWALETHADAQSYREDDGAYFFPRHWFGTYVGMALNDVVVKHPDVAFAHVRELATAVSVLPNGSISVESSRGARAFDKVVVAIGTAAPRLLPVLAPQGCRSARLVQSAWDFGACQIHRDDAVVIVGSGLTMADIVADLAARKHEGPITVVSRRGRLSHVAIGARPEFRPEVDPPTPRTARALMRLAREVAAEAIHRGVDWRSAVDYVRQRTPELWRALSQTERARLMRHAMPAWETHRYLMPPSSHRRIEAWKAQGRLQHLRCEVLGIADGAVRVREEASGVRDIPADVIVNATGFDRSFEQALAPIEKLLRPLGADLAAARSTGLSVDDSGRLIGVDPRLFGRVYALGYLARDNHGDLATANAIVSVAGGIADHVLRGDA